MEKEERKIEALLDYIKTSRMMPTLHASMMECT